MNAEASPKRILLVQLKRIGDSILTAPAVAALRQAHPEAEIVAVVPKAVEDLAECMPGLTQVLAWPGVGTVASLVFGEWDLTLDFTGTDRSALLSWMSRAKACRGYAKFSSDHWRSRAYTELCEASVRELHTVDFHLALTGCPIAAGPAMLEPAIDLPALPERFALVHIGTAREEKFWPVERWLGVIHHLVKEKHLQVVLTGTNAGLERPHLDALRAGLEVSVTDLTGQLSLLQTAGVIARSSLALGVDSMAMHLAAMFQRPQVVLFGPTNPHHWRPMQPRAITLAAGHAGPLLTTEPKAKGFPMELISTQQVIDAMDTLLRSNPD
jgi:ADP-heptose:LPS heptosyltransferase